jgi:hypothetical protein
VALTEVPDVPTMDLRLALGDHLEFTEPASPFMCGGLGGLWPWRSVGAPFHTFPGASSHQEGSPVSRSNDTSRILRKGRSSMVAFVAGWMGDEAR